MAEAAEAGVPAEQPPAGQQGRQMLARVESVAGLVPITLAHEGSIDENSSAQRMPAQLGEGRAQVGQPSSSSRQAQPTRRAAAAPAAQQLPVKVSVYPRHGTPPGACLDVVRCCQPQLQLCMEALNKHSPLWTLPSNHCLLVHIAMELAGNDWLAADMQLYGGAADESQQLPEL